MIYFKKVAVLFCVTLLLYTPLKAFAGSKTGLYMGAGAGRVDAKGNENTDDDFSEYAPGYKLFAGYNFGVIPLLDLGVEGSYMFTDEIDGANLSYERSSFNALGLATLSFGPFGFFGKLGVGAWDSDTKVGNSTISDSGTCPIYGVGVRLAFFSISARLEVEYFDQDDVDHLYMTSLSLMYTF